MKWTLVLPIILQVIFLNLWSYQVMAQGASGSPYSVYGIGDLQTTGFTQLRMMGGTGIGLRPLDYVNPTNPAAYNSVGIPLNSIFDMGFNVSTLRLEDKDQAESIRNGGLSHLGLWFRYSPRVAGQIGLVPYSKIGYTVNTSVPLIGTPHQYQVDREGQGGLNKFYFGNAFQVSQKLSLGVNLSYIFGQIEETENVFDPSQTIDDFNIERDVFLHQVSFDVGLQYIVNIGENKLTLGATYEKRTALSESGDAIFRDFTDTIPRTDVEVDEYVIPAKYGLGFAYQAKNWSVAADYTYQQWSDNDFENDAALRNNSRYSLGAEWTPNPESIDYLPRITFRVGGFYQDSYLNVNRKDISNTGFSLGASLPTKTWGSLNIGYEYSQRGTTLNNLIQEQNHQLNIGLTVKNIWFRKRKFN